MCVQEDEYVITPHKDEEVCMHFRNKGGGPVKASSRSSTAGSGAAATPAAPAARLAPGATAA